MNLKISLCTDKEVWNRFVATSPQENVFCTTDYLDALKEDYELLFVEEGEVPQCGAIVILRDGIPVDAPYPLTMYQGVLFSGAHGVMPPHKRSKRGLDLTGFLLESMSKRYRKISFCLHHEVEDLRAFQWFHYHEPDLGQFRINLAYTGIVDLSLYENFDNYFQTIRSTRRNEYRRARAAGLSVEESLDIDMLDKLHEMTFARQGVHRGGDDVVRRVVSKALENKFGRMLFCRNSAGTLLSATVFLYDSKTAYYLVGANDPQHRDTWSGVYLVLENIRWCKERGLNLVDMVGVNSPNRGDFKTSFNAAIKPYFQVDWQRP